MPIYGYRCTECGHELEVLQSMSAEPLRVCPECGGALRKLLYPVGVQFKGSGFYTTDYRNGGSGSSKSESRSKDSGDSSSSSGSSSSSESSSSSGSSGSESKDSGGSSGGSSEKKAEPTASKD